MSSFTIYINTLSIVLPLFIGACIGGAILISGYIAADVPASQVLRTFKKLGEGSTPTVGILDKIIAMFNDTDQDILKKMDKERQIEKINTWCLRLNKSKTYDDLMRDNNQVMVMGCGTGVVFLIFGILLGNILFIVVGILCMAFGIMYGDLVISGLHRDIVKLNNSLQFELPLLAAEFANLIPTHKPVDKIFEDYLSHAGAFKRDIEITLADLKNKSRATALADMSARIQNGERMDEMGQFIDLLKSGANPEATAQNLQTLSNTTYNMYVEPYIESKRSTKISIIQGLAALTVGMILLIYTSPSFIQIVTGSESLM